MTLPLPAPPLAVFNAADQPWIEARSGGRLLPLGMVDLLLSAHTLDDLAVPIPAAASAILRVLASHTASLTGLDDPDLSASAWNRRRRTLLEAGRFDPEMVRAHFDRVRPCLEVFDPHRPWLQDPRLAAQCKDPSGPNALIWGRPAGNNLAWFHSHDHRHLQPVPTGQALQHLLIHRFYGPSGGCGTRTVGKVSSSKAAAGPLRATVSFHPLGPTLFHTLLASIPKFAGDTQEMDRPEWEDDALPDPFTPPVVTTWPHRLLTGRPAHALLLIPGDDGATVTGVYRTWAHPSSAPKPPPTDPYLILRTDPDRPVDRRITVRHADLDRSWWRDLDALLLAPDETRTDRRPEIFDTLNDLPEPLRSQLRVRVCGFDQDTKTVDRLWYTALTPPILAWAQERDPARAQRIADLVQQAEKTGRRLTEVTQEAWKQTTSPTTRTAPKRSSRPARCPWIASALTLYWELAEHTFWRLLDDHPDQDAASGFTRDAVRALRAATDSARARHSGAPAAVAHAVAALRRRTAPPRPRTRPGRRPAKEPQ